ncbi:MAG: PilZ domain-containing protein [Candidatus Omnitrophota bacterium]|nr:MAG: PilZ domain-containing protein [Candidatus Omnitrophota bacterium]
MVERRKHSRIKRILPVKLSHPECDILTETKNISVSGAYCSVDKPVEVMTKLAIVLLLSFRKNKNKIVKKINCKGVVVRKDHVKDNGKHSYHVGIYFNEMNERDKKTLLSYINSCHKLPELVNSSPT